MKIHEEWNLRLQKRVKNDEIIWLLSDYRSILCLHAHFFPFYSPLTFRGAIHHPYNQLFSYYEKEKKKKKKEEKWKRKKINEMWVRAEGKLLMLRHLVEKLKIINRRHYVCFSSRIHGRRCWILLIIPCWCTSHYSYIWIFFPRWNSCWKGNSQIHSTRSEWKKQKKKTKKKEHGSADIYDSLLENSWVLVRMFFLYLLSSAFVFHWCYIDYRWKTLQYPMPVYPVTLEISRQSGTTSRLFQFRSRYRPCNTMAVGAKVEKKILVEKEEKNNVQHVRPYITWN